MALITCPECGREISSEAVSCPNCGYPVNAEKAENKAKEVRSKGKEIVDSYLKKRKRKRLISLIVFLALLFVGWYEVKTKTDEIKEFLHLSKEEGENRLVVLNPTPAQRKKLARRKKKFRKFTKKILKLILDL